MPPAMPPVVEAPVSSLRGTELRDPAAARAFLLGGLELARTTPHRAKVDAANQLVATATEAGVLPPPGFVVDVATLLLGGTVLAQAPTPPDVELARALIAYEHQVIARLAGDSRMVLAGDAVARLPRALVPAAVGLTVASILRRLGVAGIAVPAGAMRATGSATDGDGFAALRMGGVAIERLREGYQGLVRGARAARDLLHESDIFVLEHLDVLESLAQRIAMAHVLEAEQAIFDGIPRRPPRRRAAGTVSTALEEEDTYPVGGFSSLTNAGSLENLVTSELVYMDDDPELDLFDVRFAEGELLYYTRDEATIVRRRRTIAFVLDPSIERARARDPELPWQRTIVALAFVHATIVRLVSWLGEEDLRFHVLVPPALCEERALLGLLLREQHERGVVEVTAGDAESARSQIEAGATRGIAQLVVFGGEAHAPRPIEAHSVDMGRGDLVSFRARAGDLLQRLP